MSQKATMTDFFKENP